MRAAVRPTPLVAREAIMEQLWAEVTASAEMGMRAVLVRGPAGIGKTRVLEAFAERARAQGAAVIAGRSPAVGGHPYAALSDMLAAYLRSTPPAAGYLRRAGDALVRLVPALTAPSTAAGQFDGLATVQAAYRLVELITERRPLVVILDDAHGADPESCEVLGALQRHAGTRPWTLVLGWRDPAADGVARHLVADLRRHGELIDVGLEPLDISATGGLMAALLGEGLPSAGFVTMLHQRTAGNPYYIEQMTRWLQDSGRLRRAGVQWLHATGCEEELPPSIEEALGERIRALPAAARSTLEWLATAGGRADLALLEAVTGGDPVVLAEALDQLAAAGLVRDHGLRSSEYRVHHPLVAECCYHEMGAARRRLCHRALARLLAERDADAAVVAVHATRSADRGDPEALDAALRAGAEAEAHLQYVRAVSWYREALDLAAADSRGLRSKVLDRLSELAAHAGELELGLATTHELLERTPPGDRVARATLLRRLAFLRSLSGDNESARAALDEGLALAAAAGTSAASLLAELALVATIALPVPEAAEIVCRGRAIAREEGEEARDQAIILGTFEAMAIAHGGRPLRALEMARDLGREAFEGGHFLPFGYALFAKSLATMVLGRFAETEVALSAALGPADEIGLMWGAAWGWALCSEALLYLGRTGDAWEAVLRAEEISRRHATIVLPLPLTTGAMLLAGRGETAAARDRLIEARGLLDRGVNTICESWYWTASALLAEIEGRSEEAVMAYERMWATAEGLSNVGCVLVARPGHVLALLDCGRVDEAVALGTEVVEALDRPDAPTGLAYGLAALALALARRGDADAALQRAERAVDLVEEMEGELLPAVVRFAAGRAMRDLGLAGSAGELLTRSLSSFEGMGWSVHAGRVRRVLGMSGIVVPARGPAAGAGRTDSPGLLSERERQVAELAADGLSSRTIALRLTISERTVENHLARIYAKLGLHSRAELIAHWVRGSPASA